MYVERETEVRSCDHCCSGKAISITYSECVFVALGIQHEKRTCHIVICALSGSTIYRVTQKKRELLKNPTKIEEIQEKNLLTEIEPLQLAL